MFPQHKDSDVEEVEFKFLHPTYKYEGFWDWPMELNQKRVLEKFVFFGPSTPEPPTRKGFQFPEEEKTEH